MMTMRKGIGSVVALVVVGLATGLSGCGGGGGDGGGGAGGDGDPFLIAVRLLNVPTPAGFVTLELWNNSTGVATPNPPPNVPLNVAIEFEFAGQVDPSSLPQTGTAAGSINITTTDGTTTVPAAGSFGVSDLAGLPPGNQRLVTFLPTPPTNPMNPAQTAGLGGNVTYIVFVPRQGSTPQVVRVAGAPVQNEATAAFITCDPAQGAAACFTDPVPGPPHVVMSTPETNDPPPPAIDPATVTNDTVSVFVSEALFPAAINLQNFRLVNSNSGAQVPGAVQFFQAGTPEAGPDTARLDYIASSQLLANVTYEIQIDPVIQDFGGNSVVLYDPNDPNAPPSGQRFFVTIPVTFCPQPPFTEDFSSTANRATTSGAITWDG